MTLLSFYGFQRGEDLHSPHVGSSPGRFNSRPGQSGEPRGADGWMALMTAAEMSV